MMDAEGLWNHIGKLREVTLAHVVIPLIGIFRGDKGSRHHLQAVVKDTASKLKFILWLERLDN